jgi:hypothetical protein
MSAIIPKRIFGNHTASNAGKFPNVARTVKTCIKRIYMKVSASPNPRLNPMPPLTFLLETATPIKVRIMVANG